MDGDHGTGIAVRADVHATKSQQRQSPEVPPPSAHPDGRPASRRDVLKPLS